MSNDPCDHTLDVERQSKAIGRACGKCILCCRVVGVHAAPALDKPPDVPCQHCAPGKGCKIYDRRPMQRRAFYCMWLVNPNIDNELYPLRSHTVIYPTRRDDGSFALAFEVDAHRPDSWLHSPYHERITELAMTIPASTVRVGKRWYGLFPRDIDPENIRATWRGETCRVLPDKVGTGYFINQDTGVEYQWLEIVAPEGFYTAWRAVTNGDAS